MTQEQKRIKIAEACGWKKGHIHGNGVDDEVWIHPVTQRCWLAELAPLPNYFSDLNAMHEAEKVLTTEQWLSYWSFLSEVLKDTSILHADASQRAEAFGLTLNLWK